MVKEKRESRTLAAAKLIAALNVESSIEEITGKIYMHVTSDTKGRVYEMLSILLAEDAVIPMVRNNKLLWKIKK